MYEAIIISKQGSNYLQLKYVHLISMWEVIINLLATLNVKDPVPVQLPLVTLQVTVCSPTPKSLPVRGTFPPSIESVQVTFWPLESAAVISAHVTETVDLPSGIQRFFGLGSARVGLTVNKTRNHVFCSRLFYLNNI